jgi:hypothetical protein
MPNLKETDFPRIAMLVRTDQSLRNVVNPKVNFSMSPEMIARAKDQIDQLARDLGLSSDEITRGRQISGYKGYLKKVGYPWWRINEVQVVTVEVSRTNGHHLSNGVNHEAKPGEVVEIWKLVKTST